MLRSYKPTPATKRFTKPRLEYLEAREVLYAVSGNAWINPQLITLGFVPDGTVVSNEGSTPVTSNLFATMNAKFGSAATWQNQILKAAQVWAQQTNINFTLITDNGADIGSGDYQQGDPTMADIRIGGYDFGTSTIAQAYLPANVNNTSFSGDVQLNTTSNWVIGSNVSGTYDVFSVAAHEIGHALGLYHGATGAMMYASYQGMKTALATDDINGIRAVTGWTNGTFTSPGYGGARSADSYDSALNNGTFTNASNLTSTINTTTKTALVQNLNITATSDADFYKFTVPTGLDGSLTVKVVSQGLSLLAPTLTLYNGSQSQLATQSGLNQYGTTLTLTSSVTAGQTYYLKVAGADTTAFGTGKYALTLAFAGVASPAVPLPNTLTANDPNPSAGGGMAVKVSYEVQANTTTSGTQATYAESPQAVANDAWGNYVVVWSSSGQDGSDYGVYARRYSVLGIPLSGEFRVNTTTSDDQRFATVAMAPNGNFVVVWQSTDQDGDDSEGIYAQRYNALGVAQGSEFRVNTTTSNDQEWPTVAMDASGNFVVTWSSSGQDGSGYGVYAKRYNASGVAQGSEFRVNTTTAGGQDYSRVAMDANGNFVVTWSSNGQDGSGSGVYAQRYNASGVAQGGEFRVNTTTAGEQDYSGVAMDSGGNFVVTWSSSGQDGSGQGVYFQRYNAAGVAQDVEIRVNTTTAGDQMWSAVALDGSGNFLITWSSYNQDASASWGVYARQYDVSGTALGNEFQVNTTSSGDQRYSSIAMTAIGTVVVAWSGNGASDTSGISTQRYQLFNALSAMQPAVPHGYSPNGCGCTSCGKAVAAVVRQHGSDEMVVSRPVSHATNSRTLPQALFTGLSGQPFHWIKDWDADDTRDKEDPFTLVDWQTWAKEDTTRAGDPAASQSEAADEPVGDSFCISVPAFGGGYQWMPNL